MQKLSAQQFGAAIGELALTGQAKVKQAISQQAMVLAAALGLPLVGGALAGAASGLVSPHSKGKRLGRSVHGAGTGLVSGLFGGGIPGAIGAGLAPDGNRIEGAGRGVMIGGGTAMGGAAGALGGAGLGALGGVGVHALSGGGGGSGGDAQAAALGALLGGGAGLVGGGYLGGKAMQQTIGKPSWEKDKDQAMA